MKAFSNKAFWGGLLFIGIGIIFLLKTLNLLPSYLPAYFFTWKMIPFMVGLYLILSGKRFGIFPLGIGIYFLAPDVFGIAPMGLEVFWPVLIILAGIGMMSRVFRDPRKNKWHRWKDFNRHKQQQEKSDFMENTVVFSGEQKTYSSYDFKGGKITAICGGMELDLTNCHLSKENNVIDLLVVAGGVTLTVSKEWNVRSEVTPVMGGVFDHINEMPGTYLDPAAEIIIKGVIVMGGLEIKRK
jgi:predicted membrane protein